MSQVVEALARIQTRVAAIPEPEVAAEPMVDEVPVDARLADLEATVTDLSARLADMEQAQIEAAVAEMDGMGEPGMMAALPVDA